MVLIFRFLSDSEDAAESVKIIQDLLDLLDSNPLNIEAFMVLIHESDNITLFFFNLDKPSKDYILVNRNLGGMPG